MPQTTTGPQTKRETLRVPGMAPATPGRLDSLDVFRGITIAGMLLVNNPGSWDHVYSPLRHAVWDGWTMTDLVFPFFVFIVGVAMTFSFAKALEKGATRGDLLWKSTKRAAIIFGLGLALNTYPWWEASLDTVRIPGVLQRIALAFLLGSAAVLFLGRTGRAVAAAVILLGYWAVETLVPVPGFGAGVLEPGRDFSSYIDRAVIGLNHFWSGSAVQGFDPEGLLGTFPTTVNVLLGVFVGEWLRTSRPALQKAGWLFAAGAASYLIGEAWGTVFPVNKALWTSSFVLLTCGLGAMGLALCYWVVDVKGKRGWAWPFMVFGTNAIAAYCFAGILADELGMPRLAGGDSIKSRVFDAYSGVLSPLNASLAFALTFVLFSLAVMSILYRKRIFLKV